MSEPEEVSTGQPGTEAKPAETTAAPATETASQETKQEVIPPKYGGKTVEDLAREMEEKDRYIQEVNERAARAEHEAMLTRNLVEQFSRGKPQEQAGTTDEIPIADDDFLTGASFKKAFQWMQTQSKAERERERAEQYISQARTAFEEGRQAVKSDPLLKGIETSVANDMFGMVRLALENKQPIDVATLRDPKTWRAYAAAKRINDGEDLTKYLTKTHQPIAPVHQETPTAGTPPQGAISLSPEQEEVARLGGFSREQFAEMLAKERNIQSARAK